VFQLQLVRRHDDRPAFHSRRASQSPVVESLEGRWLLSAFHRHPSAITTEVVAGIAATPAAVVLVHQATASPDGTYTVRFYE
jgi:hypothetical protein